MTSAPILPRAWRGSIRSGSAACSSSTALIPGLVLAGPRPIRAHDPHAFDEDIEAWVDNFLQPGNLQGGFNWYISAHQARLAVMRGEAPKSQRSPILLPVRVLWGESDPILKSEWTDRLGEYFTNVKVTTVPEAGHFVHYEKPDLACREIRAFFQGL